MSRVSAVRPWAITAAAIAAVVCLAGWPRPTLYALAVTAGAGVMLAGLLWTGARRVTAERRSKEGPGCGPDGPDRSSGLVNGQVPESCPEKSADNPETGWAEPGDAALRDRIADTLRTAAHHCDGNCGLTERQCVAAHPIQVAAWTYGVVTDVYGPIDAITAVVHAVVQPEVDRAEKRRLQLTRAAGIPEESTWLECLVAVVKARQGQVRAEQVEVHRVALANALGEPRGRNWTTLIGRAESIATTASEQRSGLAKLDVHRVTLADALGFQAQRTMLGWPALLDAVQVLHALKDDHRARAETAEAAITRVRELHHPASYPDPNGPGEITYCVGCEEGDGGHPCPTITSITPPADQPDGDTT